MRLNVRDGMSGIDNISVNQNRKEIGQIAEYNHTNTHKRVWTDAWRHIHTKSPTES